MASNGIPGELLAATMIAQTGLDAGALAALPMSEYGQARDAAIRALSPETAVDGPHSDSAGSSAPGRESHHPGPQNVSASGSEPQITARDISEMSDAEYSEFRELLGIGRADQGAMAGNSRDEWRAAAAAKAGRSAMAGRVTAGPDMRRQMKPVELDQRGASQRFRHQ